MLFTSSKKYSFYKKWGVLNILFILRRLAFLGSPILLATMLPTTTYGILTLLFTCFNCINFILPLSLGSGFVRYYYESKNSQLFFQYIGSSLIIIMLTLALIIIFFYSFFPTPLNTLYTVSLILLLSILQSTSEFSFSYLRLHENYRLFNWLNILMLCWMLTSLASLYLLVKTLSFNINIHHLLLVYIIYFIPPSLFFMLKIFPFISIKKWISYTKNNKSLIKSVYFFSIYLLPGNLGYFIHDAIDKLIINHYFTLKIVGIYGIIYQSSFFPAFLFSQISKVTITPYIFKNYKSDAIQPFITKSMTTILIFITLIYFIFIPTASWFIPLINQDFTTGIPILNELYIAACLLIFTPFFACNIHLAEKSYFDTSVELVSGIINFFLNLALIPSFGLTGAAIATLCSFILRATGHIIIGYQVYHLRFPIKSIIATLSTLYLIGEWLW